MEKLKCKIVSEEKFCADCNLEIHYNSHKGIKLVSTNVNKPGLMLAGYNKDFAEERLQVMGRTELGFIESNDKYLDNFFSKEIPCIIIARGSVPPEKIMKVAKKYNRSVFVSKLKTTKLVEELSLYLNDILAPSESIHGVLLDIFGSGVLLQGKSSIGKSETALELVYRGHRLVADDSVNIKRTNDVIYGTSPKIIKHFMEIRGVGIFDIKVIYGEGSVIDRKRVELVIELENWDDEKVYERVGETQRYTEILGVKVPKLLIPVVAGRNLAVVIEVATRDFRLKQAGYNTAKVVQERMEKDI